MEIEFLTRFGRRLAVEISDPLIGSKELNISLCPANCTFPRGQCVNGSCQCEFLFSGSYCESFSAGYLTTFASLCYLIFFIATVQLILCMIYDAQDGYSHDDKWKKAFRVTIRKCLLGTVIGAMGTRAIYFTVQHFSFPDKWAAILHDVYYPSFITAFSVLICFWAEVFYNNLELSQTQDFMKSHQYFICCIVFNVLVYLLLLGDIIATPLINEVEQDRKSIVIGSIFIFLLLLMLVGFLHYGVRLFFRPDWRPLYDVFKINLKQQWYSCVGVISNALMQSIIIALLLLNLASRFGVVDFHSLYASNTVIHVIELGLPIWFCCTLWNFKRPSNLWLLNPGLLLQAARKYHSDLSEEKSVLDPTTAKTYGSVQQESKLSQSVQLQDCWICLDQGDTSDFFKPCKCAEVHRQCLSRWMAERASANALREAYQCQICKTKYRIKKRQVCIPKELSLRHWLVGITLLFLLAGVSSFSLFIQHIKQSSGKAILAFSIVVVNGVILQFIGFGVYWLYKHMRNKEIVILGDEAAASPSIRPQALLLAQQTTTSVPSAQTSTATVVTQTV